MNVEAILTLVFNLLIVIPLYFASKEDMKYHRINKKYVVWILLTVLIYTLLTREYVVERTFSLLITLGLFSGITVFSKGGFGFGDTLILAAIGWYIGSLIHLRYFYIILVAVTIFWSIYQVRTTKKEEGERKGIRRYFEKTKTIPIDKVVPGMILAKDYFMKGLNEKEIKKIKKEGIVYLEIKQAYPYIPVILIAFLMYIILGIYL